MKRGSSSLPWATARKKGHGRAGGTPSGRARDSRPVLRPARARVSASRVGVITAAGSLTKVARHRHRARRLLRFGQRRGEPAALSAAREKISKPTSDAADACRR